MNKEKITFYSHLCILCAAIAVAAYLGLKFVLPIALPFGIAYLMAVITERPAGILHKKTGASKKFYRTLLAILLMGVAVGGGIFVVAKTFSEAWELLNALGEDGTLSRIIDSVFAPLANFFDRIGFSSNLQAQLGSILSSALSGMISVIGSVVSSVISGIPKIILFAVVSAISTVYFAIDFENINNCLRKLLPSKVAAWVIEFKNKSLGIMLKYLRSYMLIMLLTFSVMFFGLSLIGIKYALLMAVIIAFLDMLPVIGIGAVLVPWGAFMLIVGNSHVGIGLFILYFIGMIVRQIAEPRIVGKNLGIHPIMTLVLMYVGYNILGFFGLVLLPLFSVILKTFIDKNNSAEVKE